MGSSEAHSRSQPELPSLPDALEEELLRALDDPELDSRDAVEALCETHPDHASALRVWLNAADPPSSKPSSRPNKFSFKPRKGHKGEAAPGGIHPDRIGPYRILDVLGEGGMGVVYLAEQTESLRRRVALKVVRAGMDSRQLLRRFQAESRALALMEHNAIARVYDVGTTGDGRPYFAMEYVDGLPLTAFCDSHRLGIRARLELFQRVCAGVQHAHEKGVVHRDLKPSNVLVRVQDGRPVPKIIDFGLVRAVEIDLVESTLLTARGALLGTPGYMSPEQAGVAGPVDIDARTDVYSLGAILFELLVGKMPWDSDSWRTGGIPEIREQLRSREIERPSANLARRRDELERVAHQRSTSVRGMLRRVRGDLDVIVKHALARDRDHRYSSASELSADVRRHLAHEPIEAARPTVATRGWRWTVRHLPQLSLAALVVLVLGGALWSTFEARQRAARLQGTADGVRKAFTDSLAGVRAELEDARGDRTRAERARAALTDQLTAAERRLATYALLGVTHTMAELEAEADELWPAWPERLPDLRAWLERARTLVARSRAIRLEVAELQRREGTRAADLPTAWRFDDPSVGRLHDELIRALTALEDFGFGSEGTVADVRRRAAHAARIGAETIDAFRGEWAAARGRVLDDPRFSGFDLAPQVGLQPLGPDPVTGLETFLHPASADPARGFPAAGRIGAGTGIVFALVPPAADVQVVDPGVTPSERPTGVRLDPVFIAVHELTTGQWRRLCGAKQNAGRTDGAMPATGASWSDLRRVLQRHALDLPTRAQWLHAGRGGVDPSWPWWTGPEADSLLDRANLGDPRTPDALDGPARVGTMADSGTNGFGLFDVHGNVAEWSLDPVYPDAPPRDGDGLREGRGARLVLGGSYRDRTTGAMFSTVDARLPTEGAAWIGCRPVRRVHGPAAPR